jgi:hypothetical protein
MKPISGLSVPKSIVGNWFLRWPHSKYWDSVEGSATRERPIAQVVMAQLITTLNCGCHPVSRSIERTACYASASSAVPIWL